MAATDLGTAAPVAWRLGVNGATVTLTVTLPDGTAGSATAVTEVAGVYSANVTTPQPGRYRLAWAKAAAPAQRYVDVLDVWPADPRFIASIEECITALNIRTRASMTPAVTDDLRLHLAAATVIIEDIVGAVLVRTITQVASGGKTGVSLWERPDTIVSVNVGEATLVEGTDFVVDTNAGIIYAGPSNAPMYFQPGRLNIEIVYTVGSTTVEPDIRLAVVKLVKRMWQLTQQAQHGGQLAGDTSQGEMVASPSGYMVPVEVYQLCKPKARIDGIG